MFSHNELTFHPKYVKPYYLELMGCNFRYDKPNKKPLVLLKNVRDLREELSHEKILQLLNSSWRPSKVGAWIIGLGRIEGLKKDLIDYLNNRPIYCEHVLVNLTFFNAEDGNKALVDFASRQLELMLDSLKEGKPYQVSYILDKHSFAWALNAIRFLDSINSTSNYSNLINSETNQKILEELDAIVKNNPREKFILEQFIDFQERDMELGKVVEIIEQLD